MSGAFTLDTFDTSAATDERIPEYLLLLFLDQPLKEERGPSRAIEELPGRPGSEVEQKNHFSLKFSG